LQPEQDVVAEVMRITNGNGARVAFDSVGGPDLPKLISALTNRGIVYIYGALSRGAEIEASQASASDT
jgi:NADPH:quinone reductase-like Zn-dependent oxidoreductase